jgi:hypothetical protein
VLPEYPINHGIKANDFYLEKIAMWTKSLFFGKITAGGIGAYKRMTFC